MIEKISNENNLMRTKRRINMQQNNKWDKGIKKRINGNKIQKKEPVRYGQVGYSGESAADKEKILIFFCFVVACDKRKEFGVRIF